MPEAGVFMSGRSLDTMSKVLNQKQAPPGMEWR